MSSSHTVLRAFGLLVAAKTMLTSTVIAMVTPDPRHGATVLLSTLALAGFVRRASWGPAALLASSALAVAASFPHTLNHAWFELVLALVLWRAAIAPAGEHTRAAVRARLVLQFAILSLFFFSGLQKVLHGRFVSGETLLSAMMLEQGDMSHTLGLAASLLAPVPPVDPSRLVVRPIPFAVPPDVLIAARLVAVAIVSAEILVPLLVIAGAPGARWMLLAMQVGIGLVSGECGFAITATGAVLLFWPRPPRIAWIGAVVLWASWAVIFWSAGTS